MFGRVKIKKIRVKKDKNFELKETLVEWVSRNFNCISLKHLYQLYFYFNTFEDLSVMSKHIYLNPIYKQKF